MAGGFRVEQIDKDIADHAKDFSIYFDDPHGNRYEITTYDHDQVRERLGC